MIGGIYAIRKDFLEEIGYYDDGLEGWGGENVEMTMKVCLPSYLFIERNYN